jgi:hypothetical protein
MMRLTHPKPWFNLNFKQDSIAKQAKLIAKTQNLGKIETFRTEERAQRARLPGPGILPQKNQVINSWAVAEREMKWCYV